jgi:hypothetical protein
MTWKTYRLVFRIESPLHIGWRKTGNLMQTRYDVPGRAWWGGVTASLTRWLGRDNYREIGEFVRRHLRLGYFFPAEEPSTPLYPVQGQEGTVYGECRLPEATFEQRFLNSQASTAIAAEVNAGQDGSLHEVEFITASLNLDKPVYLVGHLFVDPNEHITAKDNDVEIRGISLFTQVIAGLQIGGERRYGFGRLTLCRDECEQVKDLFGYAFSQQNRQCCVTVPAHRPLFAHAVTDGLHLNGTIEPLVSREWAQANGPGRQTTLLGVYNTPGSLVTTQTNFVIAPYGIWKQIG